MFEALQEESIRLTGDPYALSIIILGACILILIIIPLLILLWWHFCCRSRTSEKEKKLTFTLASQQRGKSIVTRWPSMQKAPQNGILRNWDSVNKTRQTKWQWDQTDASSLDSYDPNIYDQKEIYLDIPEFESREATSLANLSVANLEEHNRRSQSNLNMVVDANTLTTGTQTQTPLVDEGLYSLPMKNKNTYTVVSVQGGKASIIPISDDESDRTSVYVKYESPYNLQRVNSIQRTISESGDSVTGRTSLIKTDMPQTVSENDNPSKTMRIYSTGSDSLLPMPFNNDLIVNNNKHKKNGYATVIPVGNNLFEIRE